MPSWKGRTTKSKPSKDKLTGSGTWSTSSCDCTIYTHRGTHYPDEPKIKAQTIVVENNYIDHDYLEDYAGYYVRCYEEYERWCKRLHFFDIYFSPEEFESILKRAPGAPSNKELAQAYLGFVVVKPLPQTIIGRTCLKTYPEGERRKYPITRSYPVNLFGLSFEPESLAFQEQDHVVAACSTSALWSVLQGTGKVFHHHIPSPVEITKMATEDCPPVPPETRSFPNNGLSITQMSHAIKCLRLVPFLLNATDSCIVRIEGGYRLKFFDEHMLKSTLYAYLHAGIPILMTIALMDLRKNVVLEFWDEKHAVAITGYRLGKVKPVPYGESGFLLKASRINKIYAHDDQVGPFARMVFHRGMYTRMSSTEKRSICCLSTSWKNNDGKIGTMKAVPQAILIPLYHKIRIPFQTVHKAVLKLNMAIERLKANGIIKLADTLEWDIYLTTNNRFKAEAYENRDGAFEWDTLRQVLAKSMPRFIWRATAYAGRRKVLDLLMDATGIEQGALLSHAIGYDRTLFTTLQVVCKKPHQVAEFKKGPEWKILKWFSELEDQDA